MTKPASIAKLSAGTWRGTLEEVILAKCKSCGRGIFFLRTAKGKDMPCDIRLNKNLKRIVVGVHGFDHVVTPHWVTCPDADKFRRKDKS